MERLAYDPLVNLLKNGDQLTDSQLTQTTESLVGFFETEYAAEKGIEHR